MNNLWQDLRYGMRMLMKNPGFTAVAVITLALGIGANTAIFTYLNAAMNRILTFEEPDRVAFVWSASSTSGSQNPVSAPDFIDWLEQAQSFEALAAATAATRTLTGGGEPERVSSARVTTNFFQLLGVRPSAGRAFLPDEEKAGANNVVLLSHQFWQRRFGGEPNVLQRTISLDGRSYTVVGIVPADFRFLIEGDVYEPLALDRERADRNLRFLTVFGRLKAGVTLAQADAEMQNIAGRIADQFPGTNAGWSARVMSVRDVFWGPQGKMAFALLLGVVLAVLLIACANIANLQFARAASRQREIAVRVALGAGRFRLIRQLLTENLLLALLGGALGLLLAVWGESLIIARYGEALPLLNDAVIDGRVLGYTLLLTLLSALVFGLAPALQASQLDLHEALKEGARSGSGSRRTSRARQALIVAEISLALALLVVAGLMIRTIIAYQLIEPGFDPNNLLTMRVSLPERDYTTDRPAREFFARALEQLAAVPGVKSAGAITRLPLAGSSRNPRRSIIIEGRPVIPRGGTNDTPWALDLTVSSGYFETIGIPLLAGRLLSAEDHADAPLTAVISQTMARKYWPNAGPLGQRFKFESTARSGRWITIVGVVGDVRNDDVDEPPLPQVYLPHAQNPAREMSLVVRTRGDPLILAAALRASIWAVDRNLPVYEMATMQQIFFNDLAGIRVIVELLGAFAVLALILAATGIYGVMSYAVAQRTNEIGIRLALGAQRSDVLKLVISQGAKLVLTGSAIGLAGALALAQLLKSLLFGVSATDPLTFCLIVTLLGLVALLACYLPARRATKVDPMVALRYE